MDNSGNLPPQPQPQPQPLPPLMPPDPIGQPPLEKPSDTRPPVTQAPLQRPGTMSDHQQQASTVLSPMGKKLFHYIEFDDSEVLIAEIRKHPIGAIVQGIIGVLISIVLVVSTMLLAANIDKLGFSTGDGTGSGTIKAVLIIVGLILGLLALAITALSIVVYLSNIIFITDQKIAEVAYISVFNRKVTQLGIGSVEDVTVAQQGLFPRLFHYGTIVVETAGEVENCDFSLLPNPNFYSQKIIEAHELYVRKYGN